jgi:hypothetical protein
MDILIDTLESIPSDWNKYLLKNNFSTIHNTIEYAKYSVNEGYNPLFIKIVNSQGNIILQNILYEYNHQSSKLPKRLGKIVKKFDKRYMWHYGPIYETNEALEYFFRFLKKEKKKFFGTSHPLAKFDNISIKKKKWSTFLIDLKQPKDEIFLKMDKKSVRKNIERSIERGVIIEKINQTNLKEYFEILNYSKKDSEGEEITKKQIEDFWNHLNPIGLSGFIARKDGLCLGGMFYSFFNKYMNEWGIARAEVDFKEKLYSQDLIKSKIIEWGIKNDMNWYDLSGFNPNPTSTKEKGIFQYKKKWGGKEFTQWIIKK